MVDNKKEIEQLSLRDLRMIWTICSEGSISKAAKALGVSQPTVSYGVDKMRTIFSDPLFERDKKKLVPTELCETLASAGMRVLNELGGLGTEATFDPTQTRRKFVLLCRSADLHIYDAISDAFIAAAPNAGLELRVSSDMKIDAALQLGIDAYVGSPVPAGPGVEVIKTRRFGVDMIFNPDLVQPPQSLADMADHKFAINWAPVLKDRVAFGKIDRALALANMPARQIVLSTNSLRRIAKTIREHPIIFTASRFSMTDDFVGLVHMPVPFEVEPFEMCAAWSTTKARQPANQWFNELVERVLLKEFDPAQGHWVTTPYEPVR